MLRFSLNSKRNRKTCSSISLENNAHGSRSMEIKLTYQIRYLILTESEFRRKLKWSKWTQFRYDSQLPIIMMERDFINTKILLITKSIFTLNLKLSMLTNVSLALINLTSKQNLTLQASVLNHGMSFPMSLKKADVRIRINFQNTSMRLIALMISIQDLQNKINLYFESSIKHQR